MLGVFAEEDAAEDVNVAVLLALHGVVAKVGEQTEAGGAVLLAHAHGDFADAAEVFPELGLRDVLFWHAEKHYRHPAQAVAEDDEIVVLIKDVGGRFVGDDVAEDAVKHGAGADHVSRCWRLPPDGCYARVDGRRPPLPRTAL